MMSKAFLASVGGAALLSLALARGMSADAARPDADGSGFVEAHGDFPREEKNLRKWDAPIVADLDQDGWLDLILNDHGFGVRIMWNNDGRFASPFDLVMGDMHGITVGDFDRDGHHELVISPGGGSGSNARKAKMYRVDRQRRFTVLPQFQQSMKLMRGRTVKFFDGDNDGDLDLINFAYPASGSDVPSESYIYENDGTGQLTLAGTLPSIKGDGQKTLLTDFNGDGIIDLLLYGQGRVTLYQGLGDLTFRDVTDSALPYDIRDVTAVVEFDYDNDGDFDLFFTRGRDFKPGETFFDSQTSTWGFYTTRGKFDFGKLVVGDILKIENYQSQWPHKKLFVGESAYEYEFPGETHSGRDIRLVNSDALGWPEKTSEKGAYVGYVGNEAWRLAGDIWSPVTGIVHGVRSYAEYDHPKGLHDILLENRNGQFIDVTMRANLYREEHTTGAAVADFDNNGFQDLLILRRGDLIHENESHIYLNHGEGGFKPMDHHNVVSPELGAIGLSAETFDYNGDGMIDIVIGNERGKWHLFRNQLPAARNANYVVIEVGNSESGQATALGALVAVKTGELEQVNRIGATGAAYSLGNNPFVHFGLGAGDGPVDIKVTWSTGEVAEHRLANVNQRMSIGTNDRDASSQAKGR